MVESSSRSGGSNRKLGIELTVNERGRLIVSKLLPGPISAAGIRVGDELVMVGEDTKTINQPFSNLSDLLHSEGPMPTKFGFLRPGLRDIIEVDLGDSFETPLLNKPANGGKLPPMSWSNDIYTVLKNSTAKSQKSLPAPEWKLWDGPEDEPLVALESGTPPDFVRSSEPLLHPVTYAGESAVLRTIISGRLQATLGCLTASCLVCFLMFLVLEDPAFLHL
jgi:hypothetical protein